LRLAKGYEKDRTKLEEKLRYVYGWRDEVKELEKILANEFRLNHENPGDRT
jgi:hypothetical protein